MMEVEEAGERGGGMAQEGNVEDAPKCAFQIESYGASQSRMLPTAGLELRAVSPGTMRAQKDQR